MNTRMDRSRLNIGVYYLARYARTEEHIRDLAACGVDFVTCMEVDRPALDRMHRHGVGAVVEGVMPGWWGGKGENAGQLAASRPLSLYEEAAARFEDHPAIWGVAIGDEPSAVDLPHYGQILQRVEQHFPQQFAYLNLYPSYAVGGWNTPEEVVQQLGVPDYESYVDAYCRHVPADYLCLDFYVYSSNVPEFFHTLRTAADTCTRTGRSLWVVLQVNSYDPERTISLNQLRFQAYSAMAFGAETLLWACYTAGWWHHQVLDEQGRKTPQYERLQAVNAEIHHLGEAYMRYRRRETFVISGEDVCAGLFEGVCSEDGSSFLAGHMTARDGSGAEALMLCAANDPQDEAPHECGLRFRCPAPRVRLVTGTGEQVLQPQPDGAFHVQLPACGGALVLL